jgi:hypothetical protein
LGLDPNVLPLTNSVLNGDKSLSARVKAYCFSNTVGENCSWQKFHDYQDLDRVKIETWLASTYSIAVEARHPVHREGNFIIDHPEIQNKFFIVELSMDEFSCYWTAAAREGWNNFPIINPEQIPALERIKSTYEFETINIDCFLDKNTWAKEYIRICKLMNITPYIQQATNLYNVWYDLRVKTQKEQFDKLSTAHKQMYVNNRLDGFKINKLNLPSTVEHWQRSYYNVKDPSWPDCPTPEDYYNLPQTIQDELKSFFNIHPDNLVTN